MLPEIEARLRALEERRERLLDDYSRLTEEQLRHCPGEGTWNLLQVAEHLLMAEQGSLTAIERRSGQRPVRNLKQRVMGVLVAVVLKLGMKVKVPSRRLEPGGRISLDELRREWDRVGRGLRGLLAGLTEEEIGTTAIRHPLAGPMDFRDGLDFLCGHFDHHLRQVDRIRRSPGFSSGPEG